MNIYYIYRFIYHTSLYGAHSHTFTNTAAVTDPVPRFATADVFVTGARKGVRKKVLGSVFGKVSVYVERSNIYLLTVNMCTYSMHTNIFKMRNE